MEICLCSLCTLSLCGQGQSYLLLVVRRYVLGGCVCPHGTALYNYVMIRHNQACQTRIPLHANIHNSHAVPRSTASVIFLILFSHHLQKFPSSFSVSYAISLFAVILFMFKNRSAHLRVSGKSKHEDDMI